jgi:hypothetical protein
VTQPEPESDSENSMFPGSVASPDPNNPDTCVHCQLPIRHYQASGSIPEYFLHQAGGFRCGTARLLNISEEW